MWLGHYESEVKQPDLNKTQSGGSTNIFFLSKTFRNTFFQTLLDLKDLCKFFFFVEKMIY